MPEATLAANRDTTSPLYLTVAAAVAAGEIWQLPDGRAGFLNSQQAAASGDQVAFKTEGHVVVDKTTGMNFLDGGPVYWDHSANKAHYKKVSDRDFFIGTAVGDAANDATTATINLNNKPEYTLDLVRDAFTTVITGTQALGGLEVLRRGGALEFILSSTNEAQKLDALSVEGIAAGLGNAIIEFAFRVPSDGAGTVVDVNIGIASATHATDADSIAQHLFMHLDANNTNINFQSKDGTTTVGATDSTQDYTEGSALAQRVEGWLDCRDPANVKIYVNGTRVLSGTTFNLSAAALTWFLLCHLEKTASTDTYQFALDWLRARLTEL